MDVRGDLVTYLSSPNTQAQAHIAHGCPVLISFGCYKPWIDRYVPTFDRLLIDSGAFSELNSGRPIDCDAYAEFSQRMMAAEHVDACATLDDIRGDWQKGLENWDAMPWTFPVYHDSDPPRALDAILERLADDRPQWLGLGMVPPRGAVDWLENTVEILNRRWPGAHLHGFALRQHIEILMRYDGRVSVDSTNWILDVKKYLDHRLTRHLTPAEALEIVVKRYQRERRRPKPADPRQGGLFDA